MQQQVAFLTGKHPSNPQLASYDLIAVAPGDETLLHQACEKMQIDIISVDLSSKVCVVLVSADVIRTSAFALKRLAWRLKMV